MKVIHLLRKPCSEGTVAANVLKFGTGALNIDATRIGTTATGRECAQPTGRWPANLVLQHLPTCEQTGTREEPGYTVNRFTDGAKPFGGGAGHPYESEHVPPSTVPVWACGAGCPVAGLDAQSGPTGSWSPQHRLAGELKQGELFGTRREGTHYGDYGGGASRFFKQVGGTVSGEE